MIFNVPNLAPTESVFVLRDTTCISEVVSMKGCEVEAGFQIFLHTFCISLLLVRDDAVYDFKTWAAGWSILAAGKSVFTLIYQTWRLASYYLDYSLTSTVQLCEAGVFMTGLGKISQGCEGQEDC